MTPKGTKLHRYKPGDKCLKCQGEMGKGRCQGMCKFCYDLVDRQTNPLKFKENRRVIREDWKSETYKGFTPTPTDWARLAAFLDGEGSIGFNPRKQGSKTMTLSGRICVVNTDIRLPNWIMKTFGMKFHLRNSPSGRSEKWKRCFVSLSMSFQACWVLHNCLPWFLLKREQAEIVIANQEAMMGAFERGSGIKTPDNVVNYRLGLKAKLNELNRRGPKLVDVSADEQVS